MHNLRPDLVGAWNTDLGAGPHLGIMGLISDKTNELLSENTPIFLKPEYRQWPRLAQVA